MLGRAYPQEDELGTHPGFRALPPGNRFRGLLPDGADVFNQAGSGLWECGSVGDLDRTRPARGMTYASLGAGLIGQPGSQLGLIADLP